MSNLLDTLSIEPIQVKRNPVIILGMHRSGTSVLTRSLASFGMYHGAIRDINDESWYFMHLNRFIMRKAHSEWDNPELFLKLLDDDRYIRLFVDHLKFQLSAPWRIGYFGLVRFLKLQTWQNIGCPWGWKDPRNSYTLPLWLKLFPNAKVLYIKRHGVDVASSLRNRAQKHLETVLKLRDCHNTVYRARSLYGHYAGYSPVKDLNAAFGLWLGYLQQAEAILQGIPVERKLEIRFEDYLLSPEQHLTEIAGFCSLTPSSEEILLASKKLDPSRAFAYKNSLELLEFSHEKQKSLREAGY